MSSFSLPPLSGGINFDVSQFTGGMAQVAAQAGAFPGQVASGIDEPLRDAEGKFQSTGNAAKELGEATEHGMMAAEAAMQLFPPLVIELIESPILGAIAVIKELGEKVAEIVGEIAGHFRQIGLESLKTGLDPETLSTFGAAAKQSGVSIESLANGMELLQQRAAAAMAGDEQGIKGFENLGISATQLAAMMNDPKEMLLTVADAMAALPTQGDRVRVAMEAMGRGGKEMLPFLQQGRDGIEALATKLGDLGARVGTEETEMGATWAKMGSEFGAMWEGVETKLASPVLKYLSDHMDEIMPKIEALAGWIGDGIGGAMQSLGPWIDTVWGLVSGLGDTIGGVIKPLLEAIAPILEAIATSVKTIMDAASVSLDGLAAGLHLLVGGTEGADAAISRGDAAAHRLGQDLGLVAADPKVNVEHVHINVNPGDQSQAIADKITPELKKSWDEYHRQQTQTAQKVTRSMGGRR